MRRGDGRRALLSSASGSVVGAYLSVPLAQSVATFALLPLLADAMSPGQYGAIAAAQLSAQILTMAVTGGLGVAIMRRYAVAPGSARRAVGVGLLAVAVGTVLVTVSAPAWSSVFGSDLTGVMRVAGLLAGAQAALELGQAHLRVQRRASTFAASALLRVVGGPLLGLLLVWLVSSTPTAYISGLLVTSLIAAVISIWSGGAARPIREDLSWLRSEARIALPTVPHAVALLLIASGDRVVIERSLGLAETGTYHLAYLLGTVGIVALQAVNNAWSASVILRPEGARREFLTGTTDGLLRLVAIGTVALVMASPAIVMIVAPASYDRAEVAKVLSIVATSCLFFLTYTAAINALVAAGRTSALLWAAPVCAAANIAANAVLVPRYGLSAAAWVTVATYGLLAGLVGRWAGRAAGFRPPLAVLGRGAAWAAGALCTAAVLDTSAAAWIARIVVIALASFDLGRSLSHFLPSQPTAVASQVTSGPADVEASTGAAVS